MLMIKEPIRLKCRESVLTSHDDFFHKINSNYNIITTDVRAEELLHMVTTPPEIYLMQEEGGHIINHSSIYNSKEVKVDILNNLLNRLSLTDHITLSYQDKIYIDTTLRKLGIKNTAQFLEQINHLKQVNRSLEERIEACWNYVIQSTDNEINKEENIISNVHIEENTREDENNYLYESIMNRLDTGLIYQIMDNFTSYQEAGRDYIHNHQLLLTQQKKTARHIFLNQMENYITGKENPFVYLEQNYYENLENLEENYTDDSVNSLITQALLYRLTDSLHMERLTNHKREENIWLNIRSSLYKTAENLLFRMINREVKTGNEHRETRQVLKKEEILKNRYVEQPFVYREEYGTHSEEERYSETRQLVEQQYRQQSNEYLQQQIQEINTKNIENHLKYQSLIQEQEKRAELRRKTPEERKAESLQALTNPEELLLQYKEEAHRQQQLTEIIEKERLEFLPEETRRIYRMIEEYQKNTGKGKPANISRDNLGLLLKDSQQLHHYQDSKETVTQEHSTQKTDTSRVHSRELFHEAKEVLDNLQRDRYITRTDMVHRNEKGADISPQEERILPAEERTEESLTEGQLPSKEQEIIYRKSPEADILTDRERIEKTEVKRELVNRWNKEADRVFSGKKKHFYNDEIHMIHKESQKMLEEEDIQEILSRNRSLETKVRTEEIRVQETKKITLNNHQEENRITQKNLQDITELIDKGVKKQLGSISDQVYHRLEKKLSNEKKRRGF